MYKLIQFLNANNDLDSVKKEKLADLLSDTTDTFVFVCNECDDLDYAEDASDARECSTYDNNGEVMHYMCHTCK